MSRLSESVLLPSSRQQWGDRPTYEDYRTRFPDRQLQLERALRQVAAKLTPTVVRIYYDRRLVFSTRFSSPLEFGRQKVGEPPPYCRLEVNGAGRIIVASLQDNWVSRSHLYLDIVAKSRFKVENRSAKLKLLINSTERLPPGGGRYVKLPLLIFMGKIAVNVAES